MSVVATPSELTPAEATSPFTVSDLEGTPDDGRRYELIDGTLLVTPAPGWYHQEASGTLYLLLRRACPRHLRVLAAPFGVRQDEMNEVEPDVLVARYEDLTPERLAKKPVLAVEVVSPSSRLPDASLKKAFYERWQVTWYWLVDPNPDKPSVTAFELAGLTYREVAHVTGEESWTAQRPFPVTVVPAELVAGLKP